MFTAVSNSQTIAEIKKFSKKVFAFRVKTTVWASLSVSAVTNESASSMALVMSQLPFFQIVPPRM